MRDSSHAVETDELTSRPGSNVMAGAPDRGRRELEAVQALAPLIAAHRKAFDRERRLPDAVFAALADAGLFRLWLPQALGGPELCPFAFARVVEAASAVDGSVGWLVGNGAGMSRIGGYLDQSVVREWYADPRAFVASATGAVGTATAVAGGYRLSGRWPFGSGAHHATRFMALASVKPDDPASPLLCCYPGREDVTILDNWHVSGLRGTGSCDFEVRDIFVLAAHVHPFLGLQPTQPGLLYRMPPSSVFAWSICGVPLGIASGAITSFAELAKGRAGSRAALREREIVQATVGRTRAMLRAARTFLIDAMTELMAATSIGGQRLVQARADIRLANAHAAETATSVTDAGCQRRRRRHLRDLRPRARGQRCTRSGEAYRDESEQLHHRRPAGARARSRHREVLKMSRPATELPMSVICRPARPADLEFADALVVASINDLTERHGFGPMAASSPPKFQLFSMKDDPDGLWVAEENGRILGFAWSWVCGDMWFLAQLFVSPDQQGRNIGNELIKRTIAHAEKSGASNRVLITFSFNTVSQGLYIRHGLLPRFPIYSVGASREQLLAHLHGPRYAIAPLALEAATLRRLAQADERILGVSREKHHRYLISGGAATGFSLHDGNDWIGYAYVDAGGHIGPLAVTEPHTMAPALRTALYLAAESGASRISAFLPGTGKAALDTAMTLGMRIKCPMLLMSSREFGDWAQYLPRNPGFM